MKLVYYANVVNTAIEHLHFTQTLMLTYYIMKYTPNVNIYYENKY